jgi:hypothetical protein
MTQVSGANCKVGLFDETTWGVTPSSSPAGRVCYFTSLDISPNQALTKSQTIGQSRGVRRSARGNLAPGGTLNAEVAPENIGYWLRHLLGTPTTTGTGDPAAAPWTHVFKPATLPEGFTLEKDWTPEITGKTELFAGCRLTKGSLKIPSSGFVMLALDVLAKSHTIGAAALDSGLTDPGNNGFSAYEATVKIDGSAVCTVSTADLTIDNAMNGDLYTLCSGGQRYALPEGRCAVAGSLELVFDSFTLLEKAIANTAISIELILTKGAGDGTAGDEKLSFLITDADIIHTSPPITTESGIMLPLSFEAFADGADLGIEVTLKNMIAAGSL